MRSWRLPAMIALPAALAAAVLGAPALEPSVTSTEPVGALVESERQPGVSPDDPVTWFCPGVVGDHQITLANIGDEERIATVRVADATATETVKRHIVSAGSIRSVAINELGVEAGPSATIESDGPGLVATHEMIDEGGPSRANCSQTTGTQWVVPGGDTSDGANDNIVFYNPFPADAVVEVEFVTQSGTRPDNAEVLVRGRRTARLSTILEVPLERVVSVDATVVSGQVVGQRVARTSRERTGLSITSISEGPALQWAFPVHAPTGSSERYLIFNPNEADASVDVDILYDDIVPGDRGDDNSDGADNQRIQVEPFQIDLLGRSVEELDLGAVLEDRLPRDRPHTVVVRSVTDQPVVVDQVIGGVDGIGLSVGPGQPMAATEWIHTVTDPTTQLMVQNPGSESVEVRFVGADTSADWHDTTIELRPRTRQVVELDGLAGSQIVWVEADGPIISAEGTRSINDEGDTSRISSRPGLPVAGTTSAIPS